MICANCATPNEAGRKFCKECGTGLAVSCSNCRAANTPDAKFCGECGTSLPGGATSSPPTIPTPQPVGEAAHTERRLVSVLFADLVGFTTIAEGRDPEDTRELLSRYFDLARDVINRHGGTVEKFIGDAVMAVWGAPVAREDDAERAVRAALALVDGVKSLGPEIAARAAVLTGEAAVNIGASGEGMVAGDIVNTASRLQAIAPTGAVLVGESTERAANQAIQFEPVGEQVLKGKSSPVAAFRALRVVAEVGGRNRAGVLEAPFVGRDDDFRLLKDLFHTTSRDRRPRLVSVMGPAGIGKSRLAWEFSKYADGLVDDTYWHAGRSPSYGEGITFWALGEMIRGRAGLLETDDEATTRQKIGETVERWSSDPQERRSIESALLILLGLGTELSVNRDELFAAWRTLFERIAEHGPTVLLFEDLQWADSGLMDFIDHLLDWTRSLPIFVITLARPELLEHRPDWGAGRRNFVSLALEPLSEQAMHELLDGLVPGVSRDVKKQIVARADGVPLYAVETVRMLVAEGKLAEEGGVYHPVGELTSIAIPETLSALIAARLDSLEPHERSLLQAAAVLGQSFTVAALEGLSGIETERLKPILDAFVRRELFTVEADSRSPERGQYSFVQALIREVAYNQLARNERKSRHLAAARWFESLGDDELAGVLAGHYAAAHRNAQPGPEADALAGQARIALRGAAERAANLGSRRQAVTFLTQALELTQDPAERAALLERAGSEETDPDAEAAHLKFQQAMVLYRELGDVHGVARTAVGSSICLMSIYQPVLAVRLVEAAVAETDSIRDEPDGVRLQSELVRAYANSRNPKALELVDAVLEKAERLELMPIVAEALINRALVLGYEGRYYEPTAILRGVLPLTEALGLNWARTRALNNLAVSTLNDDVREGDRLLSEGIELSRRTGTLGAAIFFQAGRIYPNVFLGEWDKVEELIAMMEDADTSDANITEHFQLSALYMAFRGQMDQADAFLDRARPLVADQSVPEIEAQQAWIEAAVSAVRGRFEQGYRLGTDGMAQGSHYNSPYGADWAARSALWMNDAARARAVAAGMADFRVQGRVLKALKAEVLATAAAMEDRASDALTGYRVAIAIWRALDVPVFLGLCLSDLAVALGPSQPEAASAADEARDIWLRLGAAALIERLDEGLSRWPRKPRSPKAAGVSERAESSTSA